MPGSSRPGDRLHVSIAGTLMPVPLEADLRDSLLAVFGGDVHPGATAGGMGAAGLAGDDHVRLEASKFVVQLVEGGGAHGKGGTQVAYGPDEDVPVQVAYILEGNQYPHGGSGLGLGIHHSDQARAPTPAPTTHTDLLPSP